MATYIFENYIVEIATTVPRRWTPYRSAVGGINFGGNFYSTRHIEVPDLTEEDSPAPLAFTMTIGNADNLAMDLWSDGANRRAVITISKLTFNAAFTSVTSSKLWFVGRTGRPTFEGELVRLECSADMGRRGVSPSQDSDKLMSAHLTPADGTKTPWFTGGEA